MNFWKKVKEPTSFPNCINSSIINLNAKVTIVAVWCFQPLTSGVLGSPCSLPPFHSYTDFQQYLKLSWIPQGACWPLSILFFFFFVFHLFSRVSVLESNLCFLAYSRRVLGPYCRLWEQLHSTVWQGCGTVIAGRVAADEVWVRSKGCVGRLQPRGLSLSSMFGQVCWLSLGIFASSETWSCS